MGKYLLYAFLGFWGLWFIWYMTGGPLRDSRKSPFINADPASGKFEYTDKKEVEASTKQNAAEVKAIITK
jgi:hypothetical protein